MGSSTDSVIQLTDKQLQQFEQDGYIPIEGWADAGQLKALRTRAEQLLEDFDPQSVSIFSTRDQTNKTDTYFLESGSNVSCFFEEKAFGPDGNLAQPKALSINKIGHAMHDLDPVFRSFSRSPRMAALLQQLGQKQPLPVQSMYIFKQPHIGGEVVPHQDSSFLYTDPPSVIGLWMALEDANLTNGCLWALPGSHKAGLARRFTRAADGAVSFDKPAPESWDTNKGVPLEVKAGTLVVLHGALVHWSSENNSPHSRHAYTMHSVDGNAAWAKDNWMQRDPSIPFEPMQPRSAVDNSSSHLAV